MGNKECPYCKKLVKEGMNTCRCGYIFEGYKEKELNTISEEPPKVKVIDFDMSFSSMVIFMVKWTIASIPAMIILFVIMFVLLGIFGISLSGLK